MANSVDPDQMEPSDLGLHCLPRIVSLNIDDHYITCKNEANGELAQLPTPQFPRIMWTETIGGSPA